MNKFRARHESKNGRIVVIGEEFRFNVTLNDWEWVVIEEKVIQEEKQPEPLPVQAIVYFIIILLLVRFLGWVFIALFILWWWRVAEESRKGDDI